eukprot:COSAG06_NODE_33779_length_484_cov_0.841558_1_plen_86_part_10
MLSHFLLNTYTSTHHAAPRQIRSTLIAQRTTAQQSTAEHSRAQRPHQKSYCTARTTYVVALSRSLYSTVGHRSYIHPYAVAADCRT